MSATADAPGPEETQPSEPQATAPQHANGQRQLETHELVKSYGGRRVVNGVSITVGNGEIVGLLGENGAGKTTTFYMVVGLVRPEKGTVVLDGQDISRVPMHQRARLGLGYLAQDPSVFRRMTVEENLIAILELQPLSQAQRRERAEELLVEMHLYDRRHQVASTLSGGERRRTEIARSLAVNPSFLLLDEPFTGVDPLHVGEIRDIVHELRERLGIGVLLTDHNPHATLRLCDRGYLMSEGSVFLEGTSKEIAEDELAREKYLGRDFKL